MEIIYQTKTCSKCNLDKPLGEFRNQRLGKYGKKNYCIICDDLNAKEVYQRNKEKRKGQIAAWNKEHPDKTAGYQKNWRDKQKT